MPEENLDKTRVETNLEIAVLSAEQLAREREQLADQMKQLKEHEARTERLRWEARREDAAALRKARIGIMGEADFLKSKWAIEIPEEVMQEAQLGIRTELSKRAGVLGVGEAASESRGTEYRMAGQSQASETQFVGTDMSEGEDRAEPMAMGMSLADLQRQDAARKPGNRTKAALRLSDMKPPKDEVDEAFENIINKDEKAA